MTKDLQIKFPGLWKYPEPEIDLEKKLDRPAAKKIKKKYKIPRTPEPRPQEVQKEAHEKIMEDKVAEILYDKGDVNLGEEIHTRLQDGVNSVLFSYEKGVYFAAEPGQFRRRATEDRISKLLSFCENYSEMPSSVDVYYFFEGLDEKGNNVKCAEVSRKSLSISNHPDEAGKYLRDRLKFGGDAIRSSDKLPAYAIAVGVQVGDVVNKLKDKEFKDGFFYSAKFMWVLERSKYLAATAAAITAMFVGGY
jgi:hypothetical protein